MPKDMTLSLRTWQVVFLRELAHERRTSMNEVVRDLILKAKLERESGLQPALGAEETNNYAARTQ
jgi:hypothetical protein